MTETMTIASWYTHIKPADSLLDPMIDAQDDNGSIKWAKVTRTWAAGFVGGDNNSRIVVVDTENTNGIDIANLTLWAVNPDQMSAGVELPE